MPSPDSSPAGLPRRTVLGGLLGLAALAGCTGTGPRPAGIRRPAATSTATDPDVVLAATVLAAEQAALERIRATMLRHPQLRRVLSGTEQVHDQHARLLAHAVPTSAPSPSPSTSPSPSASPSASASASTGPTVRVPPDPARALAAIAATEDELTLLGRRSSFSAQSGAFARILATMAAASAQQAVLLRRQPAPGARR